MSFYDTRRAQGMEMLNSGLSGIVQQANLADATKRQQAEQEMAARRAYLVSMIQKAKSMADVQSIVGANPGDFKGITLPDVQPSDEDVVNSTYWKGIRQQVEGHPGQPLNVDPVLSGIIDPKLAAAKPWMETTGQRYTYTNPQQLPPAVVNAQGVSDKLLEDANEKAKREQQQQQFTTTLSEIEKPKLAADITLKGAQAGEARAKAGEAGAHAGLYGAQTQMLNTTGVNPDTGQLSPDLQRKRDLLVNRQASLDGITKGSKNSNERSILLANMPPGVQPAMNDKELETVRQAEGKAELIGKRIDTIANLADVTNSATNRGIIAYTLNQAQGGMGAMFQAQLKRVSDSRLRDYIYNLQQLREEIIGYRQYFGNSPVRSDKQVALLTGQVPDATMGSKDDVLSKLKSFAPVSSMIQRMYGLPPYGKSALPPQMGGQQQPGNSKVIRYDAQGNRMP